MEVHLPNPIARDIERHIAAETGDSPLDVIEKALKLLNTVEFSAGANVHGNSEANLDSFRGMAPGWTIDQMLRDRRDGLL